MGIDEEELWELNKMYAELIEKQDEVIFRLSAIVKRQDMEVRQMAAAQGMFREEGKGALEERMLAEEALAEYKGMLEA